MWLPFFCLLTGLILAKKLNKWTDEIIRWGLYILIVSLGLSVGSDHELLIAIPKLGIISILFFLFPSIASVGIVYAWEKLVIREQENKIGSVAEESVRNELIFALKVVFCLILGLIAGFSISDINSMIGSFLLDISLIFIFIGVGVSMRYSVKMIIDAPRHYFKYMMIPILITAGSLIGGLGAGYITGLNLNYATAIGGGMAYYSLVTAVITEKAGTDIGLIAFLANFMRELFTLILAPFLVRFSKISPIAVGGASTMDTTLAIIKQSSGGKYTLIAFFNGVTLSIIVPILLVILLK